LNSQAVLQSIQKKYQESEATSRRALLLSRQDKNQRQELSALVALAATDMIMGHFDEALEWNQSALKLATAAGSGDIAKLVIGNMGASYFLLGDFENAKPLFRQAADEYGKRKMYDYQARWLMSVAECYYAERDYGSAEAILKEVLPIARSLEEKTALAECLDDLAAVALETGRLQDAENYHQEEVNLESAGLDQSFKPDSQLIRARIASGNKQYVEAERLFQSVIEEDESPLPLKWEAQARLAKTLDSEDRPAMAEKQYQQAIGKIEAARKARTHEDMRFSFLSSSIEFYEDFVDFLAAHGRAEDALKVAELSRARTLVEGLSTGDSAAPLNAADVRPREVAAKLKQTVLFYWIGRSQSHLWVITPTKTDYFKLAKSAEIVPLVKSYRKSLRSLRDAQDAGSAEGEQLYSLLVEPASKLLKKDAAITLLPDPSLSSLNFETLVVRGPRPHFWIEDVTLTTASSLTLLAKVAAPSSGTAQSKGKNLLLIGNAEPVDTFSALPKAHEEMQRVERYFPEGQRAVLEGKGATPRAFIHSEPGRFAYLHFVTHGTASVTLPLDSAVILSRDADSSYKLYAREIVQHRLTAQLVTISACEGANGRAYSGEGLVGLTWAFLRAGAHNVVGALWEVNDSAAPQIMDVLYGEIDRGSTPAVALRAAKLSLLRNKDPEIVFRKPYYWAAFQLYAGG
jgi:CHAT domain-containing protein